MNQAGTTTIDEAGSTRGQVARARFASFVQRHGALIALVLVCIFAFARYETFLTTENLLNILRQNSMVGLIALGMTFVILTGGIDLSVGSLLAVAGVVAAGLAGQGLAGALDVPYPIIILFAAFALGWLVLTRTRFGRHVYAVGDNEDAARLMGLNVGRVTAGVYALSGMLAGLAGVMLASRLGAGQPVAGVGWELDAIAAVVVGGTLLTGGKGSVAYTLVGVMLLGVIFNIF